MHPLPASEVRRRGDRMRRRRTGALAAGAAAAVALIATSSVVAAQNLPGGNDLQPAPPGPTETASVVPQKEIPDDFPLFDVDVDGLTPGAESLAKKLSFCGEVPLASVRPVDALVQLLSGGEFSDGRTLLLFDDNTAAAEAEAALLQSAVNCPRSSSGEVAVTNEVLPVSPFWPGQTIQATNAADSPYPTYDFVLTVRAGPALLLTEFFWGTDGFVSDPEEGLTQARSRLEPVITAMEQFGPVVQPTDGPDPSGLPKTVVPADFPIDEGMKEHGGDFGKTGPGRGVVGVGDWVICGERVWPVGPADRLAVNVEGPEYGDDREVVTFGTADRAIEVLDAIRAAAPGCRTEGNKVLSVLDRDTGYDTVTLGLTYSDGLGSTVVQFTRVGRGVLVIGSTGEGSIDSLPRTADEVTATTGTITPAMCIFTEAGC